MVTVCQCRTYFKLSFEHIILLIPASIVVFGLREYHGIYSYSLACLTWIAPGNSSCFNRGSYYKLESITTSPPLLAHTEMYGSFHTIK